MTMTSTPVENGVNVEALLGDASELQVRVGRPIHADTDRTLEHRGITGLVRSEGVHTVRAVEAQLRRVVGVRQPICNEVRCALAEREDRFGARRFG